MNKIIPTKTSHQVQDKLPDQIINLISIRNKIRKKWQRTRLVKYKIDLNKRTNVIKAKIAEFRNNNWTNKLKKLNVNDNSLWRMTKIFKNEFHPVYTLTKNIHRSNNG